MRNRFGRGWSGSEFTFVHTDPGKDEPILKNQDWGDVQFKKQSP